jgi:toxin-antitoxin system PIN domain toxin
MSATLDANVLLYASDRTSRFHASARAFLDGIAEGPEIVYLFWPIVMAYLRIATHPSIFESPLPAADAEDNVASLLGLAHVQSPGEQERFWSRYREASADATVRGNLVPDAHVVALMRENGVKTIWTHDRDYRRFTGIDVRDPFG